MSFGRGETPDIGYGDAEAWGGPENGVDVMESIGAVAKKPSAKVSTDTYTFLIIALTLAVLWLMGGVFRKVRI